MIIKLKIFTMNKVMLINVYNDIEYLNIISNFNFLIKYCFLKSVVFCNIYK